MRKVLVAFIIGVVLSFGIASSYASESDSHTQFCLELSEFGFNTMTVRQSGVQQHTYTRLTQSVLREAGAASPSEFNELWTIMERIIAEAWQIDIGQTTEGRDMVVEMYGVSVLRKCLDSSLKDEPTSGSSSKSDEEWYRM